MKQTVSKYQYSSVYVKFRCRSANYLSSNNWFDKKYDSSPQIGGWKLSKSVSGYLHADVKKSDDALTSLSIAYPSVSESGNQWEKKYIDKLE